MRTNRAGREPRPDGDSSTIRCAPRSAALKDQALRYAADAENTRRRAEREVNDARAYAIQKFAKDLLGVADNLARALDHAPQGRRRSRWRAISPSAWR